MNGEMRTVEKVLGILKEQGNGVPNLDCMNKEDLMDFWDAAQNRRNRQVAKALAYHVHPNPRGYCRTAMDLGAYAANKAAAVSCRERGDIHGAQVYENICDSIYIEAILKHDEEMGYNYYRRES